MLLISRMRDESPHGMRSGVIRTVGSTGGVITAAGLIFAASMFGLLFASISTMVQAGFVIGIGLLLDTFLVRTITGARHRRAGRPGELVAAFGPVAAIAGGPGERSAQEAQAALTGQREDAGMG